MLAAGVLHTVELGVVAAEAQKLVVGAGFLDFAAVEDDDAVGFLDGAEAVGQSVSTDGSREQASVRRIVVACINATYL